MIIVCVVVMTIFQLATNPAEPESAPRAPAIPVDAPDAILALLAGADESLNVTNPTDRSLLVRDGGFGPEVLISLRSTDSRQSGILAVRPDGTVIAVHPAPR